MLSPHNALRYNQQCGVLVTGCRGTPRLTGGRAHVGLDAAEACAGRRVAEQIMAA